MYFSQIVPYYIKSNWPMFLKKEAVNNVLIAFLGEYW